MRRIVGFLSPTDLVVLRAAAVKLYGYRTDRGYTYVPVDPVPLAMQALHLRARVELPAQGQVDCFFLRYTNGQAAALHTDPGRHARLIALVDAPTGGGELIIAGEPARLHEGDAVVFDPAEEEHEVTPVTGHRLVWSVGVRYT